MQCGTAAHSDGVFPLYNPHANLDASPRSTASTSSSEVDEHLRTPAQLLSAFPVHYEPHHASSTFAINAKGPERVVKRTLPRIVDPRFAFPTNRTSEPLANNWNGRVPLDLDAPRWQSRDEPNDVKTSFVSSLSMAPFVDDGGRLVPEHSTRLQSKPLASIPQTHASTLSTAPMHDTLGAPFQPKTFGSRLRSNSAPSRKRVRIRDGSAGSSSGSSASTFNTPELVGGFSRFTNGPISIAMRASPSAPELRIPPWTHRERNASVASSRVAQDDPRSARSRDEYDVDPVEVVAPVSLCEAVVLPHPRLQKQSPKAKHRATSSDASSHKKGKARALSFGEGDDSDVRTVERPRRLFLDDETGEDSSVRRVLRENEESRKEREAWSDSAAHALGSSWRARSATRGRGRRKRSEADEAEVETSTMSNEQRRGDLQRLRQERERQAHLLAATDREDFEPPRTLFKPVTAEYSPPVAHSFDPFADLGRKLSVKRSLRHRGRGRRSSGHATNSDTTGSTGRRGSHDTGAQDRFVDSYPRFVGGQPIRHIRTSPSVDSLSPRLGASIASTSEMGPTQYGEALSSVTPAPASPQPVKYKQNAAVSLPPHLHHLLRSPEAPVTVLPLMDMPQPDEYTPHRPPPSAPTHTRVTSILNEEQNGRRSSSDSIALLALALGTKLELEADEEPMITDTRRPSLEPRAPVIERARLQEDSPRGAAISSVFPGRPSEAPALPTGRSLLPPSPKQQRRSSLTPRRLLPPRVPESALFDLTNGLGISRAGPARSGPSRNLAMFATTGDDPFRPPSPQSRRQSAESRESSSDGDSSELDLDLDEADEAFGGLFFRPPPEALVSSTRSTSAASFFSAASEVEQSRAARSRESTSTSLAPSYENGARHSQEEDFTAYSRPRPTVSQHSDWYATSFGREYLGSTVSTPVAADGKSPFDSQQRATRAQSSSTAEDKPERGSFIEMAEEDKVDSTSDSGRAMGSTPDSFIEEWSPPPSPRTVSREDEQPTSQSSLSSNTVSSAGKSGVVGRAGSLLALQAADGQRAGSTLSHFSGLDEFPHPPAQASGERAAQQGQLVNGKLEAAVGSGSFLDLDE